MRTKKNNGRRFSRSLTAIAVSSVVGMLSFSAMAASDTYGEISGQIVSAAGTDLTGATITIKHEGKGFSRTVSSNDDGEFILKALPVGSYTIIIEKDGFENISQANVRVSLGKTTPLNVTLKSTQSDNTVVITGALVSKIDTRDSKRGINLTASELELLPVEEDITSAALLAPGNAEGDSDIFGGIHGGSGRAIASQGGSIAENGFFLNGVNITDIRYNAIISDFPWEMVEEIQVITDGIPAQYGRTVGSVANIVSKSGDNEFRYGMKVDWRPEELGSHAPDFNYYNADGSEWTNHIRNSQNAFESKEYSLYASGPLIKDKMFFYALIAPSQNDSRYAGAGMGTVRQYNTETDTEKSFFNIDWEIADGHSMNAMYLNSDKEQSFYDQQWNAEGGVVGSIPVAPDNMLTYKTKLYTLNYSGYLTDFLTVSATAGKLTFDEDLRQGTPDLTPMYNCTAGPCVPVGNWSGRYDSVNNDERSDFRVDFEWDLDDHTIAFGYTSEKSNSKTIGAYHGPDRRYEYVYRRNGDRTYWSDSGNDFTIQDGSDYMYTREFTKDVDVDSGSSALYVEDTWQTTEQLTLTGGLRSEHFWNETNNGERWIDLKNQIAPRLSMNFDLSGDGKQKVYANWGRYFQPVAQRVSERFTAPEVDVRTYSLVTSYNADGTPNVGPVLGTQTYGNGDVRPGIVYAADNIKPMYLDSFSLGYEHVTDGNWLLGVRYTQRDLKRAIEDSAIDSGVLDWCADTGYDCNHWENNVAGQIWNGGQARLWNPGTDLAMWDDFNGDGTMERITVPAEYIGYPKAKRKYRALEFTFDGQVTDDFTISGSYTYSKTEGNIEGLVKSDNDQRDPGWTRAFDEPQITDYSYGRLPNDRPHNFKIWGLYQLSDDWSTSFNYNAFSGRPVSSYGYHSELRTWDAEYHYRDEQPAPRGSFGRTPFTQTLSLNLNYQTTIWGGDSTVTLSVFNPFNWDKVTQVQEVGESAPRSDSDNDGVYETSAVESNLWKTPTHWQTPRYVTLSVRYEF